ncbi:hypothetical protein EMIHUDRAFT_196695 [Emiliania huxleyi CCMP1516]|uniref:Inositol polyphosphate-related phosphatase domain-containing protein n=2 Tax=Emiliania huxleyi TaxID=2903 RepID=A0A0D3J4J6_EMIH1|nr:hypothetical protein EMIHUDRAFT_196695 [Emiliania huxleyi CCMP1516]EOD18431.1 hypothetical protein EMIHUDRAFT_196695 [Emiliania huxleyi CCMP1516]|eukprot:XP_005770860.1 hypothetical protein EMIHUDRAFT_196695 [Emiliania huxleyi CCMP1516]
MNTDKGRSSLRSRAKGLFSRGRDLAKGLYENATSSQAADGSHEYDPGAFGEVRELWVQRHMALRRDDYTTRRPLTFGVSTWNVGGKRPPPATSSGLVPETLDPCWLLRGGAAERQCDVHVVGLQEVVDLSAGNVVRLEAGSGGALSSAAAAWEAHVTAALGADEYVRLVARQLVGMLLLVYVRADLAPFVGRVASDAVGTGALGLLGNKGAVGASLTLHASSFAIVNCHLAAGHSPGAAEGRNGEDGWRAVGGLSLEDHDYVIWLGDLNYRLEAGRVGELLAADQLRSAIGSGAAFQGYREGAVSFLPTYKYDPGSDEYDSSEKRRAPAWCDRILWRECADAGAGGPSSRACPAEPSCCLEYGRRDIVLSVSAQWQPTCIGVRLESRARAGEPIRAFLLLVSTLDAVLSHAHNVAEAALDAAAHGGAGACHGAAELARTSAVEIETWFRHPLGWSADESAARVAAAFGEAVLATRGGAASAKKAAGAARWKAAWFGHRGRSVSVGRGPRMGHGRAAASFGYLRSV